MMSHPASVIEGGEVGLVEEENVERRRGERACGTDSGSTPVGRDRGEYVGSGRLCSSALWSRNKRSKLDALGSGEGWDFTEGECLIVSS